MGARWKGDFGDFGELLLGREVGSCWAGGELEAQWEKGRKGGELAAHISSGPPPLIHWQSGAAGALSTGM